MNDDQLLGQIGWHRLAAADDGEAVSPLPARGQEHPPGGRCRLHHRRPAFVDAVRQRVRIGNFLPGDHLPRPLHQRLQHLKRLLLQPHAGPALQ